MRGSRRSKSPLPPRRKTGDQAPESPRALRQSVGYARLGRMARYREERLERIAGNDVATEDVRVVCDQATVAIGHQDLGGTVPRVLNVDNPYIRSRRQRGTGVVDRPLVSRRTPKAVAATNAVELERKRCHQTPDAVSTMALMRTASQTGGGRSV